MKDTEFLEQLQRSIRSNLSDRFVLKSDADDKNLSELPIREGCHAGGACGCLGICLNIVGKISRKDYEETINVVKTMKKEDFDKLVEETYYKYRTE